MLCKKENHYCSHPFFIAISLLILCFILYGNCLQNAFLMDDYPMLIFNFHIGEAGFLQLNPQALEQQAYFRPLTHFINFMTFSLFDKEVYKYHLTNLFLFYLSGLAFYEFLNVLFKKPLLSFLTVILFYAHPINGVLVNYKNATAFSLMILAMNLSLMNFVRSKDREAFPWLAILWFVIALLCHEVVVVFPLYLMLTLLFLEERPKRIFLLCSPVVGILVVYLIFRLMYTATIGNITHQIATHSYSVVSYFATVSKLLWWYLEKLVIPKDIVLIWGTPVVTSGCWGWVALGVLLWGSGVLMLRHFRYLREIAFGAGLLLAGFVPVWLASFSRPWFGTIIEPHWVVYSSLGFFVILSACFLKVAHGFLNKKMLIAIFLCLFVFYSVETWGYNRLWSTQKGYCEYWARVSPYNYMPKYWLAIDFFERKNYKEAGEVFTKLLNSGLHTYDIYQNLGIIEYYQGNDEKALAYLNKSLEMGAHNADVYYYLGCVYMRSGESGRAKEAFHQAFVLDSTLVDSKRRLDLLNQSK
ncbi:MAG: hypothetical protein HQL21_07230 [Candidatus Omnitrophica bacterium]|nr:hypothetical protein [Candidatus Omnitrophota bacterium]